MRERLASTVKTLRLQKRAGKHELPVHLAASGEPAEMQSGRDERVELQADGR